VWTFGNRRRGQRAQALSRAINGLPAVTRQAMLDAVEKDELIVGAYTDRHGRICPMLAAHRRGVRIGVGTFPRAWDSFARAARPRLATERELDILRAMLEESLVNSAPQSSRPGAEGSPGAPDVAAARLNSQ
jgi:hypothetical protein